MRHQITAHPPGIWGITERIALLFFATCSLATLAILVTVMAIAITSIATGSVEHFRSMLAPASHAHDTASTPATHLFHTALDGIELMLLAPLPHLILLTIAQFLQSYRNNSIDADAHLKLTHAKALVTSILIAATSTDMVSRSLSNDNHGPPHTIGHIATLLPLILYYYILTHTKTTTKNHP